MLSMMLQSSFLPDLHASDLPVIVVADDDVDMCRYVADCLGRLPCRVIVAHNGADALSLAEQHADHHLALIIADDVMPLMTGSALKEQVAHHPTLSDTPVLLITGSRTNGLSPPVLSKPFNMSRLLHAVHTAWKT
ncbi:MAG: hypothetical protein RhofKO_18530 [Rhodothermales bacterium]